MGEQQVEHCGPSVRSKRHAGHTSEERVERLDAFTLKATTNLPGSNMDSRPCKVAEDDVDALGGLSSEDEAEVSDWSLA